MPSTQFPAALTVVASLLLSPFVSAAEPPGAIPEDVLQKIHSLIPKKETGVTEFLRTNPTYDGRGTIIAIFDTGVDPQAAGLTVTSTGQPKVIDIIDGTGGGDVLLSDPVKPSADGTLAGRSGRALTLPQGMANPSGEFRLGLKRAVEILDEEVIDRLRETRRRAWDQEKRDLLAERARRRAADEKAGKRPAATKPESELTVAERDALARESLLESIEEKFNPTDHPVVFDCVVWQDGTDWRAVVDTDEDGDLRDEVVLRPFRIARETALFGGWTGSRFGVQVYDEGRVLSIVTVAGSHGTHVAGIAAAHYPENPARDGVAPGAQIISVKIGDTRIGGSADGTAYLRALIACAQHKVDVMNMSFGGMSAYQDGNNTANQMIRRLVQEYGVTSFLSAGNEGPALSTHGQPGDTPEAIGVGAYVSKEMADALYAAPAGSADTALGFSSRGPLKNGDLGIDILAPGAAIAPVAFDSLARAELMNGTSMSSPSAAGIGALLISAAKQAGLKTTPARIKAALMNSARPVEGVDPWTQGPGLAQVGAAFEHLRANQGIEAFDYHFRVETNDTPLARGPGIYWRDARPAGTQEARLSVTTAFPESVPLEARQAFEENLVLESSASWVKAPRFLNIGTTARTFAMTVDVPEAGPDGGAHYAEIRAVPASNPAAGPVFRIPVTVITPRRGDPVATPRVGFTAKLDAGEVRRFFHAAPADATHLKLRLRRDSADQLSRIIHLRGTSLRSHQVFGAGLTDEAFRMLPGEEREFLMPVFPGRTIEITLHQQWNSPRPCTIEGEFTWVGLSPRETELTIGPNQRHAELVLRSSYGPLPVEIGAKLNEAVMLFAPVETKILPGDERDLLPPSPRDTAPVRQPLLRQKFEFKVEKPFKAKVGHPLQMLPESYVFGGITYLIHESGRVLWHGGGYSSRAEIDFPAGNVTGYRDFRALELADLERQAGTPLALRRSLSGAGLAVYPDAAAAARAKREGKLTLVAGRDQHVHVEEPADSVFKELIPAPSWAIGEVEVVSNDRTVLKVPLLFQRGVVPPEAKRPAGDAPKAKRTPLEDAREELFEKQLAAIRALRTKKDAPSIAAHQALLDELLAQRPNDPALPYERALFLATRANLLEDKKPEADKKADADKAAKETPTADKAATSEAKPDAKAAPAGDKPKKEEDAPPLDRDETAKTVLALIGDTVGKLDATAVAAFFGAPESAPPDNTDARRELEVKRKEFSTKRDLLRDFALLKAEVQLKLGDKAAARSALLEAQRWEASPAAPGKKWREVEFAVLRAEGHLGLALQVMQDHLLKEDALDRKLREKRATLLRDLGWTTWADRETRTLAIEKGILHPKL